MDDDYDFDNQSDEEVPEKSEEPEVKEDEFEDIAIANSEVVASRNVVNRTIVPDHKRVTAHRLHYTEFVALIGMRETHLVRAQNPMVASFQKTPSAIACDELKNKTLPLLLVRTPMPGSDTVEMWNPNDMYVPPDFYETILKRRT